MVGQTIGNANTQSLFASTHMAGTGSSNPSMSFPFRHSDIPIATSLTGVSFPSSTGGGSTYFIRSGYILTSSMQTGKYVIWSLPFVFWILSKSSLFTRGPNPSGANVFHYSTNLNFTMQTNPASWGAFSQSKLSFFTTLNLPDFTNLTNDLVQHLPGWPPMPTKLPSYIPKFKVKAREDPTNNVMMYHLWCYSNSIMDNSIRLRLFQ